MKVAIAASSNSRDSLVDVRFGRCPFFALVDLKTDELEFVKNEATEAAHGAGISSAQIVVDRGVEAIVAGNLGPKATQVLAQSAVKLFLGVTDLTIDQVIEKLKTGQLKESKAGDFFGPGFQGGRQ